MKAAEFDAIIFDLGGVLINLDYNRTTEAFVKLGMTDFHLVYSQLSQSSLFDRYETGQISSQHFINSLLPHLPHGTSANAVVHAWNEMILNVPFEKTRLLLDLKTHMPIFLLSNTNEIHMEKVRREWKKVTPTALEEYFNEVFLSYQINLRKPDPEIFRLVCSKNGLQPEKVLFIDDSPQHIEGAKSIGLQTLHLTDPEKLYDIFS
jgi:glucose-1-phosphatase